MYTKHFVNTIFRICISWFLFSLILSCANQVEVPVDSREFPQSDTSTQAPAEQIQRDQRLSENTNEGLDGDSYTVKTGDTLYSIAWRFKHDYRSVAMWNGINEPYIIYPGQKILLKDQTGTGSAKTKSLQPGPVISDDNTVLKQPEAQPNLQPKPVTDTNKTAKLETNNKPKKQLQIKSKQSVKKQNKPAKSTGKIVWQWPAEGKLVRSKKITSKNGVDIAGRVGQPIKSSANGEVVYSGSGLLGYGRLIIVKHNETYLSAYAHNSELLVKEGDDVAVGQTIAKMGTTSSGQALLHFEIRKNGKSVNPLKYLPK